MEGIHWHVGGEWERQGWTLGVAVLAPRVGQRGNRMSTATCGTHALAMGTWCFGTRLHVRLEGSTQATNGGGAPSISLVQQQQQQQRQGETIRSMQDPALSGVCIALGPRAWALGCG
eukprot:scaffold1720_cov353-Pavlova_lutheri.AAC.14